MHLNLYPAVNSVHRDARLWVDSAALAGPTYLQPEPCDEAHRHQ
jgi:hypothetical protein